MTPFRDPATSATVYFQQTADYNGPDSFTYKAFDGSAEQRRRHGIDQHQRGRGHRQ